MYKYAKSLVSEREADISGNINLTALVTAECCLLFWLPHHMQRTLKEA